MKNQKGFTLVEIAIVLVIIGLLIGALLKGQEMIKSAKIKRVVKQADEIRAAAYTYQDLYKYLPGDDPNGTPAGNGNGQITPAAEYAAFFDHLQAKNLIAGDYTTTAYPAHAFGGTVWVYWVAVQGKTTHWIQDSNMPGEVAQIIDISYDDGNYLTGTIRGSAAYATAAVTLSMEF